MSREHGRLDASSQALVDRGADLADQLERAIRWAVRLEGELAEAERSLEAQDQQLYDLQKFALAVVDLDRPSQALFRRRVTLEDLIGQARTALNGMA